jgi:integrase
MRTEELYRGLLRNHLLPIFGNVSIGAIDEAAVRRWRKERLQAGPVAAGRSGRSWWPRPVGSCMRLSLLLLMTRLGHSSTRAALMYQHATRDRDQAIAIALGDLARQVRAAADAHPEEPRENA